MGYSTYFDGALTIAPDVKPEHREYINKFSSTRRMKRSQEIAETLLDPIRIAASLQVGEEGAYFVGGNGFRGQGDDESVTDNNKPPKGQPGLWCQWIVTEGSTLEWDENEKFYHYVEWLEYMIEHFFKPWGYTLNGEIGWQGEENDDRGTIFVSDNRVEAVEDQIAKGKPSWA